MMYGFAMKGVEGNDEVCSLLHQNLMAVTVGRIIWRGLLFDEIETEVGL